MASSDMHPQDEVEALKAQLSAVQNEFSEFTYAISHDLGAPLRAVVSFSKLLTRECDGKFDDKGMRYLQFIMKGGEKLQAMLIELLRYSRVNTQGKPFRPLEVAMVVGQCHTALKQKIAASKGSIHIHGTLPEITADGEQCFQLFLILIDNALTYHAQGIAPQVHIKTLDMGDMWKFFLEDNGIGIAPASVSRMFEVFKRLHTDEEYPGIGMGLPIARKIVERHGGEIGIASGENGGTIVWFTFPKIIPQVAEIYPSHFENWRCYPSASSQSGT